MGPRGLVFWGRKLVVIDWRVRLLRLDEPVNSLDVVNDPLPTPDRIVEEDGTVHVGWFARPFELANIADAPIVHGLDVLDGSVLDPVAKAYRAMRLKQWHYTSVACEDFLFACAVVHAGFVGTAFAYVVDRKSGKRFEWSTLRPLGRGVTIADNSLRGETRIDAPGWGQITLGNDDAKGTRRIEVSLDGRLGSDPTPALRATFVIRDENASPDPVIAVEQVMPGRWIYTHKCYALPASGQLRCGSLDVRLDEQGGHAGLDWNRGYRRLETYWNWAAGAGRSTEGERIGFNLTAHRPWSTSRQKDAPAVAEEDAADCALWLGGTRVKLRAIAFDYDPDDLLRPWIIRDGDGLVDLRFEPDGERQEDIHLGLVVSQFHQPYGKFSGTLKTPDGACFVLGDVYGVTEQHYARW